MTRPLDEILEKLANIHEMASLGGIIDAIRSTYDVDHVSYHALSLGIDAPVDKVTMGGGLSENAGIWHRDGRSMAALSYSADWIVRYVEGEFEHIDPVVQGASVCFDPLNWTELDWRPKARQQFLQEAIDHGIGSQGYSVPVRGPNGQFALFTINKTCSDIRWGKMLGDHRSDFILLGHFFHQRVLQMVGTEMRHSHRPLSVRERDAIKLIADGLSRGQAAERLGISENTFRVYIDSARHKLGALNIPHAVAMAAYKGIITP